jgi:hypothetical protein
LPSPTAFSVSRSSCFGVMAENSPMRSCGRNWQRFSTGAHNHTHTHTRAHTHPYTEENTHPPQSRGSRQGGSKHRAFLYTPAALHPSRTPYVQALQLVTQVGRVQRSALQLPLPLLGTRNGAEFHAHRRLLGVCAHAMEPYLHGGGGQRGRLVGKGQAPSCRGIPGKNQRCTRARTACDKPTWGPTSTIAVDSPRLMKSSYLLPRPEFFGSPPSAKKSAATKELLPDPDGPTMRFRRAEGRIVTFRWVMKLVSFTCKTLAQGERGEGVRAETGRPKSTPRWRGQGVRN